jgi:hypothetical protein
MEGRSFPVGNPGDISALDNQNELTIDAIKQIRYSFTNTRMRRAHLLEKAGQSAEPRF